MKSSTRWLLAAAAAIAVPLGALALADEGGRRPAASDRPELEYLKVINRAAPPSDPQLILLLMGQFTNAGRQREGAAFFAAAARGFAPAEHKALHPPYHSLPSLRLPFPDRPA